MPVLEPWEVPLDLWGHFVYYARRHRGLSQAELAEAAGVTQQTISKVEGARIHPEDHLKVRLAEALRVPTALLFPWPSQVVWVGREVAWPTMPDRPATRGSSDV